jgi:hypothetical protein
VPVIINPRELSTEDLERVVDVVGAELHRRRVTGDSRWRPRHFRLLLDRLGGSAQAAVLREAATADNGYVARDRVLELLGRDPSRRLTGFRKRIDRTVAALAETEPGFPAVTHGPLHVDYGGGVVAQGFYIADVDLPALRDALVVDD